MAWDLKKSLAGLSVTGADWVGLREVRENTIYRMARDARPEANSAVLSHGVMVEVLVDGQFGYAATPILTPAGLQDAADRALEQARVASKFGVHRFSKEQRPQSTGQYASPKLKPVASRSAGELNGQLIKICERLKTSPKIAVTMALARTVETEMRLVSTSGTDVSQSFTMISTDWSATAMDGAVVQKRTDGGFLAHSLQAGLEVLDGDDVWTRVDRVAQQALELVAAEECPNQTSSLVLMPDQMMLQIHESIGHPLEIDRILGDERNYAGSSFVKLEDFGKLQYGSPRMNVTFDPGVKGQFASYSFDDGGAPAERQFLIRNGVLERGLGGLESQARSGLQGVSNFRSCSWNRAPIDRMANLNLEPGTSSFQDILASVENGVMMESNRSWSIDDYRNKFQFGCEYARRIEKGKLGKVLRNPNYRGVTNPFWRGLMCVGDASTMTAFGTPFCGKGEPNQIIRVGHRSPVCLFENIEIFGGAG